MNSLLKISDFLRPLLRLENAAATSAKDIKNAGFSGVIFPAQKASKEILNFAHSCRALDLGFWLDLSTLAAPHETLRRQRLIFEKNQPQFKIANQALDTLHEHSAAVALEVLTEFEDLVSGVLFELRPPVSGSTFPSFPWTDSLPQSFQKRHGFNILNRIETLVSSGGDEASRIRQQFWNEIALLQEENFLTPIRHWCDAHKINFHCKNFAFEWSTFYLSNALASRLDESQHALDGAPSFPALLYGEEPTREFFKRLRTGSSLFARKYSKNSKMPGIGSLPDALRNEIFSRYATVISQTRSAAKVGVLFPSRSTQTHYHPDGHRFTRWVGEDLKLVTDLLDSLHFDWMFVSEAQINAAARAGSTLQVGVTQHNFEMFVIPSVTALSWECWQKLESFAEAGGRVACLGLLPRWSERGRDRALETLIGKDSRLIIEDLYQAYDALEGNAPMPPTIGYPVFREYLSGGRLCCYQPRLNPDYEDARLRVRQILHESLSPTFETLSENIFYSHRISDNGDLFFMLNKGEESCRVNARLRPLIVANNLEAAELFADDGSAKIIPVAVPYSPDEGGGIGLTFELASGQSRFIEMRAEPNLQTIERANFEVQSFDGQTAFGWMTQNGTPQIAVRHNKKIVWHASKRITIPTPILLDSDNWIDTVFFGGTEYSQNLTIPADWKDCRVFLEIAGVGNSVQCLVNSGDAGLKISAPFRFDVTLLLAFGASNDFALRVWQSVDTQYSPLARLVAYPSIAVKITP